jgi:hypothetical protein
MDRLSELDEISRARVNQETARIAWKELLRFFAAGTVIAVSPELDLVDVAIQMSQDNKAGIEAWMAQGKMGKVSDDQAREWLAADAVLWATVVKPWVLVQHETPGIH